MSATSLWQLRPEAKTQGNALLSPVRTRRPKITVDETGLVTIIEHVSVDVSALFNFLLPVGTPSELLNSLVLKDIDIDTTPTGIAKITYIFRGPQFGGPLGNGLPDDVWQVSTDASGEPISTNARFEDFAGTPSDPNLTNKAEFTDDGFFKGFASNAPDGFRGVTSYLAPRVVISGFRWETGNAPTGGKDVGKINTPSGEGGSIANANASGDQNWLKIGFGAEQYGNQWQVRETWLRSNDNGWNTDIYESA